MSETKGPDINWFGAAGSALGSVTAAVLLSTLGATGTVIGAGLGTLIITVGGAVYGHYLQRAKTNLELTADRVKRNSAKRRPTDLGHETAPISASKDPTHVVGSARPSKKPQPRLAQVLREISWKRVAWLAAGLFVLTMAIILVFELTTGRPVSSFTGGTSPESTGTSLTGVNDPAPNSPRQPQEPGWQPIQPNAPASPEYVPPTDEATQPDDEPFPQEQLPTTPVEPEFPEEVPEEAPLQNEPPQQQRPRQQIEPVEPTE